MYQIQPGQWNDLKLRSDAVAWAKEKQPDLYARFRLRNNPPDDLIACMVAAYLLHADLPEPLSWADLDSVPSWPLMKWVGVHQPALLNRLLATTPGSNEFNFTLGAMTALYAKAHQ